MECNKRSSYQLVTAPQFDFNGDDGLNHKALHRHYGPVQFDTIQFEEDEKLAFRNVHIVEQRRQTIKSHLEAKKILEGRPSDPSALQYLGWWHLCEEWNPESAVNYLTQSVKWGKELSREILSRYQSLRLKILLAWKLTICSAEH